VTERHHVAAIKDQAVRKSKQPEEAQNIEVTTAILSDVVTQEQALESLNTVSRSPLARQQQPVRAEIS